MLQNLALLIEPAVPLENSFGLRIARQARIVHDLGLILRDRDAVASQPNCRLHDLRQTQLTPAALSLCQTGNGPGHAGRAVAKQALSGYIALLVQVHVAGCGSRSLFTKIEKVHLALCRAVEHESTAAQIARCWMHYGQREAGRHCGIHCVATVSHDLGTDAGRLRMHAGHHDVARPNRLKALRPKRQRGQQQAREEPEP